MATASAPSLPPMYKALAKKTLGENPDHVQAHLTSFRRWVASAPHLKVPDNDIFLLSFLRYAHYEHALAQRRLDNFCTLRCSDKVTSQWYFYPTLTHPVVDTYLSAGIFIPLGFTEGGIKVILIRLKSWFPSLITQDEMRTMNNMNFERCLFDERCQVGGFALLIDMSSTSMDQATQWADIRSAKSAFKLMQEASPGRVKHLIFYKESKVFDVAFKLMEIWISDKMRDRILRCKDDINKAFKKIPGLKDLLPDEYGGKCGDIKSAIENCRAEFIAFYSKNYPLSDIAVDESKRPASARNYMKEYKDMDNTLMGNAGTYVKIDPGD